MPGDNEICTLLIRYPEKGLEKVMNKYMGFVYAIVWGRLGDSYDKSCVEECVSDVFYDFYRVRHTIDLNKGSLKSFLAHIAQCRAIDVYRRRRNTETAFLGESGYEWLASPYRLEDSFLTKETGEILAREIKALGRPDSEIILRRYYFGQSTSIIAQALELKENTVDKKVSRALVKLKKALGGVL